MNSVTLTGRLTRDPERKSTKNGATVCTFTLAVDKFSNGTKGAIFINCAAYSNKAEFLRNYCRKGDKIGVEGSLNSYNYESSGRTVYVTEVICDRVELEAKAQNSAQKPQERATEPKDDGFPEFTNVSLEDYDFEEFPF